MGKVGNKMNREREGLHINSYPEAENPRSFEETVPTIQASWHHGQHAVHCYLKTLSDFVPSFLQIQMWFQKTEE